jgi:hypothetical protein
MKNKIKILFFRVYRKFILRSPLNIKIGHYFYQNDGGFISNIVGRYVRNRDAVLAKKNGFHIKKNTFSEQLHKEGFVFYDGLIDSDVVDVIFDQWNLYCENQEMPSDFRLQLSSEQSLDVIKSKFPILNKALTEEIMDIVQQYYKSYINLLNIHLYRITTPSETMMETAYGNTGNWHTDGSSSESLKIFILLSDVTDAHGPMNLISTKNTRNVVKNHNFKFSARDSNLFIENNYQSVQFTGKKGKIMIARTNDCLHRASIPENGRTRDILTFYVTTSGIERKQNYMFNHCTYEQFYGFKRIFKL